jgi:DNA-binding GntR family transcriptional regulator
MTPTLKVIDRPRSLSDQVYATLREHLCSGHLRSGQPLQEAAVAAQLGVSRTPVREVLARLASEGLIETVGRGFVVPTLSEDDIEDIYELRLMIEPEALRGVAARITDRKLAQPFRAELSNMVAADADGDVQAFMEANYRFRAAWLRLVTNTRLLRVIEQYADHVRFLRALTLGDASTRAVVIKGLRRVAAALAASDGGAAADAMRAHLQEARRILRAASDKSGKENGGGGIQG